MITNRPDWITFTGVDDSTNIGDLRQLSHDYPGLIEWGVLLGSKFGGRFPTLTPETRIFDELDRSQCALALHICGERSRKMLAGEMQDDVAALIAHINPERIQVNAAKYPDLVMIKSLAIALQRRLIIQVRGEFPEPGRRLHYLFDPSAGRGLQAPWPPMPPRTAEGISRYGYAGGLSPDNVHEMLQRCPAPGGFWIDMETGVRTDDRFDVAKCRRVMEIVYGAPRQARAA